MFDRCRGGLATLAVGLTMIGVAGCGGSGPATGGTTTTPGSGTTSASTGSLSISMRVGEVPGHGSYTVFAPARPTASLLLQSSTDVVIHVEDPNSKQDLVPATTVQVSGQATVSATITDIPLQSVVVFVEAFNSAGNEIGSGSSNTVSITPGVPASANVTLSPVGGIDNLLAGSAGSPDLSLFVLSPDLVPAQGFTAPSLGGGTPVTMSSSTILFGDFGASLFQGNDLFWVATSQNHVVPVSIAPSGAATTLAGATLSAPITGVFATDTTNSDPVLYVTTSATSQNLVVFPINSDGSLGTQLASTTVGGIGNTPVGLLILFDQTTNAAFIHVVSNGDGISNPTVPNLTTVPLEADGTFDSIDAVSVTVAGTPVAITFPDGLNPALYVITSDVNSNAQSFTITDDTELSFLNAVSLPGTPTAATVITVNDGFFFYGVTNATSGNVIPVELGANDGGELDTMLTAGTAGGSLNTPVAATADFTGEVPFLFVGTNGTTGQNVTQFPLSGTGGLETAITATAGPGLTTLSGL